MQLTGKTALVTGASRGIGRAVAVALVTEGMTVYGTSRSPEGVDWPGGVRGLVFDVSSARAVAASWEKISRDGLFFDVVINNAGAGAFGAFEKTDFEIWERQIGLLLLGAMKVAQLALQQWSKESPGVLVQVGSLATEYPIPYMSGYNAAKAGLAAFCESLQLECDSRVARVMELRLGDIRTDFNEHISGAPVDKRQERVWESMCRHVDEGPAPELVAKKLVGLLLHKRGGVYRVGSWFQSFLASTFSRFLSHSVKNSVNGSYYNLSRD